MAEILRTVVIQNTEQGILSNIAVNSQTHLTWKGDAEVTSFFKV